MISNNIKPSQPDNSSNPKDEEGYPILSRVRAQILDVGRHDRAHPAHHAAQPQAQVAHTRREQLAGVQVDGCESGCYSKFT